LPPETRPIAERLDPEKLAAASPETHWDVRVDALKALIQIHSGERKQGIARLEAAVETLSEAEMQDWIVMPLQQHLEAARQAPDR
jgi:CHAT domain-containing protein